MVDLVGSLSNPFPGDLLQVLTSTNRHQVAETRQNSHGPAPDGRRKFGTVRDTIVKVLALADGDMRVRDIHKRVEYFLSGPVSNSSVKSYLRHGCQCRQPLFEYRGKSGYRLARR